MEGQQPPPLVSLFPEPHHPLFVLPIILCKLRISRISSFSNLYTKHTVLNVPEIQPKWTASRRYVAAHEGAPLLFPSSHRVFMEAYYPLPRLPSKQPDLKLPNGNPYKTAKC